MFYLCSYPWQWQQNAVPHGCCSISHGGLTKGFLQSLLAFCPPPNSNKRQKNKETHSPTSHSSFFIGGGHTANWALLVSLCKILVICISYGKWFLQKNSKCSLSGLVFTECFYQHRWLVRSPFAKIQFLSFFMVSFYNKLGMQLQWRLVRAISSYYYISFLIPVMQCNLWRQGKHTYVGWKTNYLDPPIGISSVCFSKVVIEVLVIHFLFWTLFFSSLFKIPIEILKLATFQDGVYIGD